MTSNLIDFEWPVYPGGAVAVELPMAEWREWPSGSSPENARIVVADHESGAFGGWVPGAATTAIVDRLNWLGKESPYRLARPLDEAENSGLFRTLASLDESDATAVAGFASRSGPLAEGELDVELLVLDGAWPPPFYEAGSPLRGEPLAVWQQAIRQMREAVHLWEEVERGDLGALRARRMPRATDLDVALYDVRGPGRLLSVRFSSPDPGLLRDGWFRLLTLVDEHLNPAQRNPTYPHGAYARLGVGPTGPAFRIRPETLLDALWLQFALAIDGNRQYRQCQQCHRWFELDPAIARTNRLYCSGACRSAHYRAHRGEEA